MIFVGKGMKGETTQFLFIPSERRKNWDAGFFIYGSAARQKVI
jgi:hypothetical protein